MPTPTLKDIYDVMNRLEDKLDRRMCNAENRIDGLETFRDNLLGKMAVFSTIVTAVVTIIVSIIKDKFVK